MDRDTVDQAITMGADGVRILGTLGSVSGPADLIAQISQAKSNFANAAAQLTPTPAGVPDAMGRQASATLRRLGDSLAALQSCISSGATPATCSATVERSLVDSKAAGEALLGLAPYSTLTQADLRRLFVA